MRRFRLGRRGNDMDTVVATATPSDIPPPSVAYGINNGAYAQDGVKYETNAKEETSFHEEKESSRCNCCKCCKCCPSLSCCFCGFNLVTMMFLLFLFLSASVLSCLALARTSYSKDGVKDWVTFGGLTSSGATFRIRLDDDSSKRARVFVVSQDEELSRVVHETELGSEVDGTLVESVTLSTLEADTQYFFATYGSRGNMMRKGSFRTTVSDGSPMNFTIATASCAWTGSKATIFSEIAKDEPLLFLHAGDFHYEDINADDIELRIAAVDKVLGSDEQAGLFQTTSLAYMWDDHDWLGDNSRGYGQGRNAALQSYRHAFPYYAPLPAGSSINSAGGSNETAEGGNETAEGGNETAEGGNETAEGGNETAEGGNETAEGGNETAEGVNETAEGGLDEDISPYHAFTIGTVRFILTDLRSESTMEKIYSDDQKQWFFEELASASSYDFVVWLTTRGWTGPSSVGKDSWMGYPNDRAELSDYIVETFGNGKQNLLVLSGDSHMVGFDDGRNTYFGQNYSQDLSNVSSFPLLHSGPLDRLGSVKGGPYSDGYKTVLFERNHQYSTLTFTAPGGEDEEACVEINSYRIPSSGLTSTKKHIFSKRMCGNIFGKVSMAGTTAENATKSAPVMSTLSIAILGATAGLFGLVVFRSCCFFGFCDGCKFSFVAGLFLVGTLVAGIGIPFANGYKQFDTVVIALIGLLQAFVVFAFLGCWILKTKCSKGQKEVEEMEQAGEGGYESYINQHGGVY